MCSSNCLLITFIESIIFFSYNNPNNKFALEFSIDNLLSSLDIIKANEPWYKDGKTEMMPQMPTSPANTKRYFLVDPFFWADYGTEIGEKWEAFKAGV